MSFLNVVPEEISSAATSVANIGSTISEANSAAAFPTTLVAAAGADEVSAQIAALFSSHAQQFQALSAQAATFHQQFVQLMHGAAGQYLSAEAASVNPLRLLPALPGEVAAQAFDAVQGGFNTVYNAARSWSSPRTRLPRACQSTSRRLTS